jgi:CxxC motif-containing protein
MLKDEKEQVEVTCIQCPMGCRMTVEIYKQEILGTKNAGCNRGIEYAVREIRSPVRDFFSTVRVNNGKTPMLSVRSTKPVPKSLLLPCAVEISKLTVQAPIRIGSIVVKDILNSGIDIIATKNIEEA